MWLGTTASGTGTEATGFRETVEGYPSRGRTPPNQNIKSQGAKASSTPLSGSAGVETLQTIIDGFCYVRACVFDELHVLDELDVLDVLDVLDLWIP